MAGITHKVWYAGKRIDSRNKISICFIKVEGENSLTFAKTKDVRLLTIGVCYPLEEKENGRYRLPTVFDKLDEPDALAEDITNWKVAERAALQMVHASKYKPKDDYLLKLIEHVRHARRPLSNAKRIQFDAWLLKEINK